MQLSPMSKLPETVKGFLIDIDGVLYVDKQVVEGAVAAIDYLVRKQIPFLLVTNTTRKSRFSLLNNLHRLGFTIDMDHLLTAPHAAALWLHEQNASSISLFLRGDTYREFKEFKKNNQNPDYIVIGDLGDDLTYSRLNEAFRMIMAGAKMVALQKNRYWQTSAGLAIDSGAVVAGLEYASRKRASIIGKPSRRFFIQAMKKIGLQAHELAIVGDDLDTDIGGGAKMGYLTIAVRTGKFREEDLKRKRKFYPDMIIPSLTELPKLIKRS